MSRREEILGVGWAFPPMPRENGGFARVRGAAAVEQALRSLLLTEPGERIGRPSYGCGLKTFLFASNTVQTRTLIARTVTTAIERHEPRVVLEAVQVSSQSDDSTVIFIDIQYRLIDEQVPRNLVFPFELNGQAS